MNDKIKSVLDNLLLRFETGDIPEAIAYMTFPPFDIPMLKWSFLNKLICYTSGGEDWRGFLQWEKVNRFVKKGAKATFILVPWIKKDKEEEDDDKEKLITFLAKPVFSVESTEGEPLEYQKIDLKELPLMEKAKQWGIKVEIVPEKKSYYGSFNQYINEIKLATPEETVWAHELSHYADSKINGELKNIQDPLQEISAELSASAICIMIGKNGSKHLGNNYRYIKSYAEELKMSPHTACLKVLNRVENILKLILE